jgi:hypothetical protein
MRDKFMSFVFDYDITRLEDNSPVYGVWHGGKTPLNGGGAPGTPKGTYIGRIHNRDGLPAGQFYATRDESRAWVDLEWTGPFTSRRDAAIWLAGQEARKPDYWQITAQVNRTQGEWESSRQVPTFTIPRSLAPTLGDACTKAQDILNPYREAYTAELTVMHSSEIYIP